MEEHTSSELAQNAFSRNPEDEEDRWPRGILKDIGEMKERWDVLIMVLILYSSVIVPFRIAFQCEAEGSLFVLEASISCVFFIDLGVAFNTAFMRKGEWVTSRREIAARYLSGWFWVDAPASVPVEFIESYLEMQYGGATHVPDSLSFLRMLRILRLVRLLRLLKMNEYVSRLEEHYEVNLRPLRVIKLVFEINFIAHLLACCWYATTWLSGEPETWIDEYAGGAARDGPTSQQYFFSFWWAITVLCAVNPIQPTTDMERQFMIFVSQLNRLLFAYIVGKISVLIGAIDRRSAVVEERMDQVKDYLQWRSTPKELSIQIKRYYEHYYQKSALGDEGAILRQLSPTLHAKLVNSICKNTLCRCPLFARLSPAFLSRVFPCVKPLSFDKGEVVFVKGAPSMALYFVLEGEVNVLSDLDGRTPVRKLAKDYETILSYQNGAPIVTVDGVGCFGQEVLVGLRRRRTVVANSHIELLILEKENLLKLFADSENIADVRRLCVVLLDAFTKREHLRRFRAKACRAAARNRGDVKEAAAWQLHLTWERYTDRHLRLHDKLYRLISNTPGAAPSAVKAAVDKSTDTKGALAAIATAVDGLARKHEAFMATTLALQAGQLSMQAKQDAILAKLNGKASSQLAERSGRSLFGKGRPSVSPAPCAGRSSIAVTTRS